MIKVTLKQIDLAIRSNALGRLASDNGLPVKTSFKLARIIKQISTEYETYDASRKKIILDYAKLNKDGDPVTDANGLATFTTKKAGESCQSEIDQLLTSEIEITGDPLSLAEFEPRKITAGEFLSANDLILLDWLITDEPTVAPSPKPAGE